MKVGLALSGGSVLGMAHLGVIRVLEEHQVPVHCVAGTSVGALVGAFFASGLGFERIWEVASSMTWGSISGPAFPRQGLLNSLILEKFVEKNLGPVYIEDLPLPFAAVAVDLTDSRKIVYTRGPLGRAVRASCAVPGIFTPVEEGENVIVDGGLMRHLPVAEARSLGADYVIGVKLIPRSHGHRKPKNLLEILISAFDLQVAHAADLEPVGEATILPDLNGLNSYNLSQAPELVQRGAEAAEAAIPKIKQDLLAAGATSVR